MADDFEEGGSKVHRRERLERAIEIARADPPALLEGDYVDVLPGLLAERDVALAIVYHSVSAAYLTAMQGERLDAALADAGTAGSLTRISYELADERKPSHHRFALEVQMWPGGERRRLARLDGHANWLEWLEAE